jgi:hypothetical protein
VAPHEFRNDKAQELLREVRIEFVGRRKMAHTVDLPGVPGMIARGIA